jgi:imidazolonepropionase-like amidohydrolase
MKKIIAYISCLVITATLVAQKPVPAARQNKSILINNVKIHVGNGTVIENGEVAFIDGKIVSVTNSGASNGKVTYEVTIDGGGKHLYPGFILTNSTIGLREVDAVRSTLDYDETGDVTPEVRAITTYNTDSKLIPTIRFNGVLIAQSTPRGGLISGQSSIVQLDAWNWEDAAIKMEDGVHVNWPNRNKTINPFNKEADENSLKKERTNALNKIKDMFERSIMYMNESSHSDYNGKCEALKGLFTGSKNLYLHVNTEKDIMESVTWCESIGIKKIVLIGAYEAYKITDFIKSHNLSIILDRVHALPHADDDDVKLPYKMAKILWNAGINFTFSHSGDMEVMGSRNLAFNAGTTVAYGMEKEAAVQMITLNAAKILGIDKQLGSIEVGKDATFFISDGDALDMKGNNLALAYINGRQIELENSQYYLYKMYMGKYGLKMK